MIILLANIALSNKDNYYMFIVYAKEYLYVNLLIIIKHLKLSESRWLQQTLRLYPFQITINEITFDTTDP
jgi:hypothetical protein